MPFYYIRPDEAWSLAATVTTSAGTTDSNYTDDWICDGRPGRPARATNGTVTWATAFSSGEVGLIAVCNCNANVNASITGGISATVTAGTLLGNGIRLNGFAAPTPASITALSVGFSGSTGALTLGEFYFGKRRELIRAHGVTGHVRYQDAQFQESDFESPTMRDGVLIPAYDRGLVARTLTGTQVFTTSQLNDLKDWRMAQRGGSKPSLIVPDSTVNDAWLVQFRALSYRPITSALWEVTLEFEEYPRPRW